MKLLILLLALLPSYLTAQQAQLNSVIKVYVQQGTAEIISDNGINTYTEWQKAQILEGEIINTNENGSLLISFGSKTNANLECNSSLAIQKVQHDNGVITALELTLNRGMFAITTKDLNLSSFILKTPFAELIIEENINNLRIGSFWAIEESSSSYFFRAEGGSGSITISNDFGSITLDGNAGPTSFIRVEEAQRPVFVTLPEQYREALFENTCPPVYIRSHQ